MTSPQDAVFTAFPELSPRLPQDAYDACCIARFGLDRLQPATRTGGAQ